MATVTAFIRTTKKVNEPVSLRFRISAGRGRQFFFVSDIKVKPNQWDDTNQKVKSKILISDKDRNDIDTAVNRTKVLLLDVYNSTPDLTLETWQVAVDRVIHPEQYKANDTPFFLTFDEFVNIRPTGQQSTFNVLRRSLQRWQLNRQLTTDKAFIIDLNTLNSADLQAFAQHLLDEHNYPVLYETIKEPKAKPRARGRNVTSYLIGRFRTFYIWAIKNGRTTNNPFANYKVTAPTYGTPFYISIDERNQLFTTDLTEHPLTEVQRDIFIFQCLVGCRYSDLVKLTPANVKGEFLEYIAIKTEIKEPKTIKVPLLPKAIELINKYKGVDQHGRLMPFIDANAYNFQIKKMFKLSGLTRLVTVIHPVTGEHQQRPINEIASSHLARRTLIGNLYKQVKDPNIIAKLSGHAEGSKAFSRYRDIDDDIKKEIIKLLE